MALDNKLTVPNYFSNFKSRSKYWGSKFGVANRGPEGQHVIGEANYQRWWCPMYTDSSAYIIGEGDKESGIPTKCGVWRCDTFVFWSFYSAGYNLVPGRIVLPRVIFNAFPYWNKESYAENYTGDGALPLVSSSKQLHLLNTIQLNELPYEEFEMIADIPLEQETPQHIAVEWRFAKSPEINVIKRGVFIDRLSILGKKGTLSKLLNLYNSSNNDEIRQKIIQGTVIYYQNHLNKNEESKEKSELLNFYQKLINNKMPTGSEALVIRGYIDLSSPKDILDNHKIIDSLSNKIELNMFLGINFQLAKKSLELEKIYIPSMIKLLQNEPREDLENMFLGIMNKFYAHLRLNESKEQVKKYVLSLKDKYSPKFSGDKNQDVLNSLTTQHYIELVGKF